MSAPYVRACLRCHSRKVKCTGYPECQGCRQAQIRCEAYVRPTRHESQRALKEAQLRIQWLQDEYLKEFGVDCASVPTGTPLSTLRRQSRTQQVNDGHDVALPLSSVSASATRSGSGSAPPTPSETPIANDAAEASLLALNASGELKYLGASSGAFFASCAAALVRSATADRQPSRQINVGEVAAAPSRPPSDAPTLLEQDEIRLLLLSYEMWVHPLYPLLNLDALQQSVSRHSDSLANGCTSVSASTLSSSQRIEMTMLYQVLALGATNRSNTIKQLRLDGTSFSDRTTSAPAPSPTALCAVSLSYLESCLEDLHASVEFVQMLLLFCIYSSYGPVGSSQWQLAGLAMCMAVEIGLHHDPRRWYASEQHVDQRRRVFWTAYAIQVTLAYNLGRPPSISPEHITTKLPIDSSDVRLGVLHIKHRQIQGRILSRMYQVSSHDNVAWEERQHLIAELQAELDQWRLSIPQPDPNEVIEPYPTCYWDRLYHSTSFVLHRTGPLCPRPSSESLEHCISSAGAYIDNMTQVLRSSNVPQSWMLIQGVLSAGLTMLISARANFSKLEWSLLLVELPSWSRKCSICLAIMSERWNEDLLYQLESHFEILSDDTFKIISAGLAAGRAKDICQGASSMPAMNHAEITRQNEQVSESMETNTLNQFNTAGPDALRNEFTADWESMGVFGEFLGVDFMDAYWDLCNTDAEFATSYQGGTSSNAAGQNASLFGG